MAVQLYCKGNCGSSWLDHKANCQSTDADALCKLKHCDEDAYAINFTIGNAIDKPGFTCDRTEKNLGNWLGMENVRFGDNVKNPHFTGSAVLNVTCYLTGRYRFASKTKIYYFPKFYISK